MLTGNISKMKSESWHDISSPSAASTMPSTAESTPTVQRSPSKKDCFVAEQPIQADKVAAPVVEPLEPVSKKVQEAAPVRKRRPKRRRIDPSLIELENGSMLQQQAEEFRALQLKAAATPKHNTRSARRARAPAPSPQKCDQEFASSTEVQGTQTDEPDVVFGRGKLSEEQTDFLKAYGINPDPQTGQIISFSIMPTSEVYDALERNKLKKLKRSSSNGQEAPLPASYGTAYSQEDLCSCFNCTHGQTWQKEEEETISESEQGQFNFLAVPTLSSFLM
eukprot:GHVN01087545.1.p1 GENE.GHVN01087545.1~~GHVN01087545.1.p1  ORF type:complete len:278 (-),score=44.65 GHVN01087545.1:127-960(-)